MYELVKETDLILKKLIDYFEFNQSNSSYNLDQIVNKMYEIMTLHDGIGLAAPQIGFNLRLFVMLNDGEKVVCINPMINEFSQNETISNEGCLSFPDLNLKIKRFDWVNATYYTLDNEKISRQFTELSSRCFQHELDHLNGITFNNKVSQLSLRMAKAKRNKLITKQKRRKY